IMALMSFSVIMEASGSDASTGGYVLVDMGNGCTEWTGISDGTCGQVLESALSENDHELSFTGVISVDGKTDITIGDTTSSWRYYEWDGSSWSDLTASFDPSAECKADSIAIGFYPEGVVPTETPVYRSSWTMVRGDAESTGHQNTGEASGDGQVVWTHSYGNSNYVCSTVLVEGPHAYVVAGGGYTSSMSSPTLYCYDRFTGKELWSFEYNRGAGYETATGAIIGDRIYLPATEGILYSIPLDGDMDEVRTLEVPTRPSHELTGSVYSTGPASIVYDSGVLYFGASNGNVYCVDLDLNIIWMSEVDGRVYFTSPTVHDGIVYCGALDGVMYAFDQVTGELIDSVLVHSIVETSGGVTRTYGSADPVVIVDDVIFLSYSDGKGMNTLNGGVSAYRMTSSGFDLMFKNSEPGLCSTYLLPYEGEDFKGVYGLNYDGLFRMSVTGEYELLTEIDGSFKAPLILVNGSTMYASQYDKPGKVFVMDLDGSIVGQIQRPSEVDQYVMSSPVFVDGMLYNGTDGGVFAYTGEIVIPQPESSGGIDASVIVLAVILIVLVIIAITLLWIKRSKGMPPTAYIRGRIGEINRTTGGSKVK
ncbi:MAG: PQQ-binding-like beta-propeller repeat protein, partial [Candidatus Methanomethylophilaceae archaeon]